MSNLIESEITVTNSQPNSWACTLMTILWPHMNTWTKLIPENASRSQTKRIIKYSLLRDYPNVVRCEHTKCSECHLILIETGLICFCDIVVSSLWCHLTRHDWSPPQCIIIFLRIVLIIDIPFLDSPVSPILSPGLSFFSHKLVIHVSFVTFVYSGPVGRQL